MNHPKCGVLIPLVSGFCEVEGGDVGKIEDPIPGSSSGCDGVTRSARAPRMELTSSWAGLSARRCFGGKQRRSRNLMSSLGRYRWRR